MMILAFNNLEERLFDATVPNRPISALSLCSPMKITRFHQLFHQFRIKSIESLEGDGMYLDPAERVLVW